MQVQPDRNKRDGERTLTLVRSGNLTKCEACNGPCPTGSTRPAGAGNLVGKYVFLYFRLIANNTYVHDIVRNVCVRACTSVYICISVLFAAPTGALRAGHSFYNISFFESVSAEA